jgi:allantoin racemase
MTAESTIMIVNPNTATAMTEAIVAAARRVASPGTTLLGGTPVSGVSAVESNVDEVWGSVGVLEQVHRGERLGVHGYLVACFGDTGVAAAKELAAGPVVGMTEAALLTAALIATRFTVVTMPRRTREQSHRVVRALGLEHRCAIRAVDVGVAEVAGGSAHLLDVFAEQGRAALDEDGAEAVVLGCAGLTELVEPLTDALGVPVVEGVAAGVRLVESLLALGLSTSRVGSYAAPERLGPVAR